MGRFGQIWKDYKSTLKSMDTEETIDLVFYRPVGYCWACIAEKLGVTPNAITIASIFLGVGAGVCFGFSDWNINLCGVLLLVWANSFDSADGQLARMTGNYSALGRILDGLSGNIWFVAIYIALCVRACMDSPFYSEHYWAIWCVAALSGVCHAKQAAMADYYRQFHLYFVKGNSELTTVSQIDEVYVGLTWRYDFLKKAIMWFYRNYTSNQEMMTPSMQKLRGVMQLTFHDNVPEAFRNDIREVGKPLMKYTNFLTFNWRSFALFVALLVVRRPELYFYLELTLFNAVLIYMMLRHERICRRFAAKINDGCY